MIFFALLDKFDNAVKYALYAAKNVALNGTPEKKISRILVLIKIASRFSVFQ